MIEELCQRYPKTFTHEPHDMRPLTRGMHKAIVADAPDLPASIVSQALAIYAAWLPYMRACIAGVKGEVVIVKQVIVAAKAETVTWPAAAACLAVLASALAATRSTPAIKAETATRQDPAKTGPERLGLAGLKAAAQRRRLAASTS
jgi:hypothetical protein